MVASGGIEIAQWFILQRVDLVPEWTVYPVQEDRIS